MSWFKRFDDVVIDIEKLVMLRGKLVLMADGNEYGVGEKAADAIRSYFTPAYARKCEQPSGTAGTVQERGLHPGPSQASAEEAEAAQEQPDSRSCGVTSSPADGSAGGEDGTSAEEGASTETAEK